MHARVRDSRAARAVIVAVVSTIAAPLVVDLVLFAVYAAQYAGKCGPHPTDIPARPCSYGEYLGDFLGDPFAIVGLVMIDFAVFVVAGILAAIVAVLWITLRSHGTRVAPRAGA
jgi:hypothetical protein